VLEADTPRSHRIAVPDNKALRVGTLNAILRSVAEVQGLRKEDAVQRLLR